MYKTSHYNLYIPVKEKTVFLVYKISTGALIELTEKEGDLLMEWTHKGINISDVEGCHGQYIERLIANGFVVDEKLDEIEQLHNHYLSRHQKQYCPEEPPRIGLSIAPTTRCNMKCDYCYAYRRNDDDMEGSIVSNIYKILEQFEDKFKNKFSDPLNGGILSVTWIGGEPTLNPSAFKTLSNHFIKWTAKNYLEYYNEIITNGLLLKEDWLNLLIEGQVKRIQVTIDGNKEKHNLSRPLANNNHEEKNYEQILENLTKIPDNIHITIRINADKQTINTLDELLTDLKNYGIWPQNARHVNLDLNRKRSYDTLNNNSNNGDRFKDYFKNNAEFYPYRERFRDLKLKYYNEWALQSGNKPMKKKWSLPDGMNVDCGLIGPNAVVISADGYIYKCWEHIDKPEFRLQPADKKLDFEDTDYKAWLNYDRFITFKKCYDCRFIPICDTMICPALRYEKKEPHCSSKKFHLQRVIKNRYIESLDNPDYTETISEYAARVQTQRD